MKVQDILGKCKTVLAKHYGSQFDGLILYGSIARNQFSPESDIDLLRKVLVTLTDRESAILGMRFGLDNGTPKTLEEVGAKFGVTRERIRQIQDQALKKLGVKIEKRDRPADKESNALTVAA